MSELISMTQTPTLTKPGSKLSRSLGSDLGCISASLFILRKM